MKHTFLLAAMLLSVAPSALNLTTASAQTYMGYTTGEYTRNDGVGFSTTENKYGVAIRLSAEKAQQLKGARIVGVRTATATRQLSNSTIFVTKELGGTPLAEASTESFSTKLSDSKFSTPIEIDGTSDLYIGYTTYTSNTGLKPCLFDRSSDFDEGTAYGYADGEWIDLQGRNYGAPVLQMILENAPDGYTDVVVKPFSASGYYKKDTEYTISGEVFNFGTSTITSLKMNTTLGEGEPQEMELTGLNIAPNASYTFSIKMTPQHTGYLTLNLSASDVNGSTDADASDNTKSNTIYIYPSNMSRKILVEQFTGQSCSNCPRGHTEVNNVLSGQEKDFVEVAHHYGYYPDSFTMEESESVASWLYNSSSMYAPAVAVNRTTPYDGLTSVVFGDGTPSITAGMRYAIQKIQNSEPYVSIGLQNDFDESTKSGKLTVVVKTFRTPSDEAHRLNVWVVQDGFVAYQSGSGSNYVHNNVLRKSFTGNWGVEAKLTDGGTETFTYEYTIPEKYQSTYYDSESYAWETDIANMRFVAFVGDVTQSALTCTVYNANDIAVNNSGATEGIHTAQADKGISYTINGRTLYVGNANGVASVYDLSGKRIAAVATGGTAQLEQGVYVVRCGSKAQKIVIR